MSTVKLSEIIDTVSAIENMDEVLVADDGDIIFLSIDGTLEGRPLQSVVSDNPTTTDFEVSTFAVDSTGQRYFNSSSDGVIEV